MNPAEITFVVLARDESRRIGGALASVLPESRRFVLDAESVDATVDVAREYDADVERRPWTNFVDARRYALSRVTTPWTFMLDADERLDERLRRAILAAPDDVAGYACVRRNRFCGRVMTAGGWGNEIVLRLVRTASATVEGRGGGTLHERLVVREEVAELDGGLDHDSYPTIAAYVQKFVRYTGIEAGEAHLGLPRLLMAVPTAVLRAGWLIVGRRAYRDGWRGMFIAVASAAYPLIVTARAWLRRR